MPPNRSASAGRGRNRGPDPTLSVKPRFVEAVLRRLVDGATGITHDSLEAALGLTPGCGQVSRMLRPANSVTGREYRVAASDLVVWCTELDTIEPLDAIAQRVGARVIRDDIEPAANVAEGVMTSMTEVADVVREFQASMVDERLDAAERRRLIAEADEAIEALTALRAALVAETTPARGRGR